MSRPPAARVPGRARRRAPRVGLRAALTLGLSLPLTAAAGVRVETTAGFDSNVQRVEGVPGGDTADDGGDAVVRVVLALAEAARAGAWRLRGDYHAGVRRFAEVRGEDALLQSLTASAIRVGETVSVGVEARARGRLTDDPLRPRDHLQLDGGPLLAGRMGPVTTTVRGRVERLIYPPDARYGFVGLGGDLDLGWRSGAWSAGARGGLTWRQFDGPRERRVGFDGVPLVAPVDDTQRADRATTVSARAAWSGAALLGVGYSLYANASDSYGAPQTRHALRLSVDAPLFFDLLVSARLELQRVVYDDPQYVAADAFIEDEGRSSLLVRLERPLDDHWSVVGHVGAWASPFGTGPDYSRELALLGVAWRDE